VGEFTRVDAAEIHRIGDAVQDVAGRVDRLGASIRPWAYAVQGAVDGSVTCADSAPVTAGFWQAALEQMADEVRKHAADLRKTADDYRATDAWAAHHLRDAG
jgi:hypothetical protein